MIFDDNATRWLCILIYICYYIMILMRGHMDLVMLRSITGPYGRLMLEVAYREILLSLHQGLWEMIAREEWLGCRHDASPMFDILGSTPVWAQCILFSGYHDIKTYMYYVFFLKNLYIYIYCIKEHWWSLTSF